MEIEEGCPYDPSGVLWRARADKKHVLNQDNEDDSSGVDSEGEDINEDDFNLHYKQTLEGRLPLLDNATRSPLPKRSPPHKAAIVNRKRPAPDAFAFDEASQQLPSRSYPPTLEEGDSPAAFNVLGDPLASQASFPFSQLPDVSFQVDEDNAEGGAAGADEASKLPDFLTDLLDEKDSDGRADSKGAGKRAPLMYQLSQTDYLQGSPSGEEAQRKKSPTKSKRTRD